MKTSNAQRLAALRANNRAVRAAVKARAERRAALAQQVASGISASDIDYLASRAGERRGLGTVGLTEMLVAEVLS